MPTKLRRPTLHTLLRTAAPGEYLILRLAIALDLFLDGSRQLRLHAYIGRSRLAELLDLSRFTLSLLGAVELLAAMLLAIGLLTRPAAAFALLLAALFVSAEFARIGSFSTASALKSFGHAVVLAAAAACLVIRGGGRWSVDASLAKPARR